MGDVTVEGWMKRDRRHLVGQKKFIGGESEAVSASKLLDDIISEMSDSFKKKTGLRKYL